jgi:hypothetical protein
VYAAMDQGVFYRDNTMSAWIPYNAGLPNVLIKEIDIYNGATVNEGRLRAGTFGRGLWEAPLYNSSAASVGRRSEPDFPEFTVVAKKGERGLTIAFTSERRDRYSASLVDLQGKVRGEAGLGEVSGSYKGEMDLARPETPGLYLLVLKNSSGSKAKPFFLN